METYRTGILGASKTAKCVNCNIEVGEEQFCPECGALCFEKDTAASEDILAPGHVLLGKYTIEEVIQTGTTNQYHASFGDQKVLVKERKGSAIITENENQAGATAIELQVPAPSVEETTTPLKMESEILGSLQSEAFQKVYDYFVEDNTEYLVLEYPAGQRLSEIISGGAAPEDVCIEIAVQLCQAVDRLHELGYANLDIEPNNIVLQDNKVRVLMLGRSRKLGTQGYQYLTTEGYSAPELYKGAEVPTHRRADVYSIGAVLYTMLTGRILAFGDGFHEILSHIREAELARILIICLATNPELRYRSIGELQQKLLVYQSRPRINLQFDTAIVSDVGMVRYNNEDCGLAWETVVWRESHPESFGLYIIADGMGGEEAGEVASRMAITEIWQLVSASLVGSTSIDCNELVKAAIEKANKEIYLLARDNPSMSSMGTTVTVGLRRGQDLYIGHVGDSRAYLLRDGNIQQLTEDHSLVAGLIKGGLISAAEAKTHPERGKIFRSLGNATSVVVDTLKEGRLVLKAGDALLFCTDGLVDNISDAQLLGEISEATTMHSACKRLIALANMAGGEDNVTVIAVRISPLT